MKKKGNKKSKSLGSDFVAIFSEFGDAMSEVFDNKDLKKEARRFANSAASSAKTFVGRFKDEDVKAKFSKVGKAAQKFGKEMEKHGREIGKNIEKMRKEQKSKNKKRK